MRLHYLFFWLAAVPLMAQNQLFTFGVKGGMPAETPLGRTDSSMPFVLGPTVNVRILPRLSIETGVLFHRLGQDANTGVYLYPANSVTLVYGTERGRALELPILAKYRLFSGYRPWQPFVTAGPTLRRTSLETSGSSSILAGTQVVSFVPQTSGGNSVKWNVDPSVGAGVDFKTGRFHLEPEVRYSYWGAGKNTAVRKNQVDVLLGFRF